MWVVGSSLWLFEDRRHICRRLCWFPAVEDAVLLLCGCHQPEQIQSWCLLAHAGFWKSWIACPRSVTAGGTPTQSSGPCLRHILGYARCRFNFYYFAPWRISTISSDSRDISHFAEAEPLNSFWTLWCSLLFVYFFFSWHSSLFACSSFKLSFVAVRMFTFQLVI